MFWFQSLQKTGSSPWASWCIHYTHVTEVTEIINGWNRGFWGLVVTHCSSMYTWDKVMACMSTLCPPDTIDCTGLPLHTIHTYWRWWRALEWGNLPTSSSATAAVSSPPQFSVCFIANTTVVSRGHTPFRKRGKGSDNFRFSRLFPRNFIYSHCASAKAA